MPMPMPTMAGIWCAPGHSFLDDDETCVTDELYFSVFFVLVRKLAVILYLKFRYIVHALAQTLLFCIIGAGIDDKTGWYIYKWPFLTQYVYEVQGLGPLFNLQTGKRKDAEELLGMCKQNWTIEGVSPNSFHIIQLPVQRMGFKKFILLALELGNVQDSFKKLEQKYGRRLTDKLNSSTLFVESAIETLDVIYYFLRNTNYNDVDYEVAEFLCDHGLIPEDHFNVWQNNYFSRLFNPVEYVQK